MLQKRNNSELNGKEKIAADYYVLHGHKSNAYRAGYGAKNMKPNTVGRRADELFKRPRVAAYVEACRAKQTASNILTRDEALAILTDIAKGAKVSDLLGEDGEISPAKVIASGYSLEAYEVIEGTLTTGRRSKVKVRNPIQAIERVAKMLGWDAAEKVDLGGVVFNINLGSGK